MSIVEVQGPTKSYPAFTLRDVSFGIEEARITGFIGRNGAGKTTTIKAMLNLLHPDSGEVRYFGKPFLGNEAEIKAKMDELAVKRREKQPLEYPSAGSTFKRPEGYYAGELIMKAGMRGFQIGGARVSDKHCGFVINTGNATAADVMDVICEVQARVKERFGVELEPEVICLGDF